MKITTKTKKEFLVKALQTNFQAVRSIDNNLADRLAYTVNHSKSASRKDIVDLTKEVMNLLGEKFVEPEAEEVKTPVKATPKAENSIKKPAKVEKKAEVKSEKTAEVKSEKTATSKVKPAKAETPKAKKSEPKKSDGVTVLEKAVLLASKFPERIEVDGEAYVITHKVRTIKELLEGEYEFAFYWTKRHLRQFPYFNHHLGSPKSFPNDLDTAQLIYVSDEGKVAYCVSDATEAPYTILPEDLEEIEGLRFANGVEFQIYRKEETDEK